MSDINRIIAEKWCNKCERVLPISSFTKASSSKDGLNWECRDCMHKRSKIYRESARGKKTKRLYEETHREQTNKRVREKNRERLGDNPNRVRCRHLLGQAVKKNYIPRPGKERTWSQVWEFHHPDYSRPYYGCWVKISEHRDIEKGAIQLPQFVDWEPIVKQRLLEDWGLVDAMMALEKFKNWIVSKWEDRYFCRIILAHDEVTKGTLTKGEAATPSEAIALAIVEAVGGKDATLE